MKTNSDWPDFWSEEDEKRYNRLNKPGYTIRKWNKIWLEAAHIRRKKALLLVKELSEETEPYDETYAKTI